MPFDSETWLSDLVASVNDDERFGTATREFDGSIELAIGDETAWLKIYRGAVIDTEPYVPAFGATFRIAGSADAWRALARGDASLSEQFYTGALRTEGNKLEANRLREATELLVRHLQLMTTGTTRPTGVVE
ncbi:hypothetical protein ACFQPA_16610 [Halomarina halobia]|uniref:SCP2 domain-containing protein n=1 Tax=Halomarina halobia TaxID=3033386 RepID=A0ABD6AFY5_9EURY|nr:hypothetical protein [Halomarina sp. PSR21]